MTKFASRLTLTWIFLSAVTIVTWQVGAEHVGQGFQQDALITAAVIGFAMVKVRFIMREFMEVRTAPGSIKWLSDAWLVGLYGALLAAYFLA